MPCLSTTIKSMILSLIMLVWRMFSSSKHSISRPREDDKSVHFHYLISASLCCKHSYQQLGCLFRYMINRTILCLEQIDHYSVLLLWCFLFSTQIVSIISHFNSRTQTSNKSIVNMVIAKTQTYQIRNIEKCKVLITG